MATPRVFVSSTCYDLKYIRENLKFFIKTIGYEPILSEDGDVFYNPRSHTHDSCIMEVSTCQIFVLIIGGRFGGTFRKGEKSITNMEYLEAVKMGIPIFALVENNVYAEHNVYNENIKRNRKIDAQKIRYPSVDNVKIFGFIDEVRRNVINNAIFPFSDFSDIENYLKKQWAGMMHFYITSETEAKRVNQLFDSISEATQKIEFFTRQVANNVGDKITKLKIELYDLMFGYEVVSDLRIFGIHPSPKSILEHESLDSLCEHNIKIECDEDDPNSNSITHGGPPYRLSPMKYSSSSKDYLRLRENFIKKLETNDIDLDEFLNSFE